VRSDRAAATRGGGGGGWSRVFWAGAVRHRRVHANSNDAKDRIPRSFMCHAPWVGALLHTRCAGSSFHQRAGLDFSGRGLPRCGQVCPPQPSGPSPTGLDIRSRDRAGRIVDETPSGRSALRTFARTASVATVPFRVDEAYDTFVSGLRIEIEDVGPADRQHDRCSRSPVAANRPPPRSRRPSCGCP